MKELDVETVLAKQETYDLFCPNCNCCITKRVILRKRKRSTAKLDTKPNPDELDTILSSDLVDSSLDEAYRLSKVTPTVPPYNIQNPSIVSIVQKSSKIPAFSVRNPPSVPPSNGKGFISLFAANKGKSVGDQDVGSKVLQKPQVLKPAVQCDTQGGDVILFVDEDKVGSTISQTADITFDRSDILTDSATQAYNFEQARIETGEHHGWEILKSIVYGGLIESITSLGIVSSAVSSGAAPLNIIALGLANLISGLFLIRENLIDLKNDKFGGDQQQTNAQDRYQELLGRRTNFILHAVVAVLSFLIFGSIPIVIYGILINKNYQPEVKLAVVAASSLICIILLAIGKVYTIRPPKSYIKTVMYYVTMALAASGVSYIAGGLVKDLLDKYYHSDSGFVITMPFSATGTTDPAWASY